MDIKVNGLELLFKMKQHTITNNHIIRVSKIDSESGNEIFICYIRFKDGEVEWKNNTFRLSMLLDDNYTFTIIDKSPIIESMKQVGISETYIGHMMRYIDSLVYNIE